MNVDAQLAGSCLLSESEKTSNDEAKVFHSLTSSRPGVLSGVLTGLIYTVVLYQSTNSVSSPNTIQNVGTY